jgi:hypothetical protein
MTNITTSFSDYEHISDVIQQYIDSARSGHGEDMVLAFHPQATIFGYAGAQLFAGPIEQFYRWNNDNGAAPEIQARIVSIDVFNTVASVRVELENWTGLRFTDLFTMLKTDDRWRITNKVFHLYP